MPARCLALLMALTLLLLAGASFAQAAERRVVLSDFQGKQAKAARAWLIAGLEGAGFDVVPKAEAFAAGEPASAEEYASLAKKLRVSAFVAGRLQRAGRGYKLELGVRNGADGALAEPVDVEAPSLPKLKAKLTGALPERLAQVLQQTAAPPEAEPEAHEPDATEPEPEPAAERAEVPPAAEDRTAPQARYPLLELALGIRGYSRDLTYKDDLFDELAIFQLGAAPAVFAALRLYPLATSSRGPLRHIGLSAGFEQGFATTMRDIRGRELGVSMRQLHMGLRVRLPVGLHELGVTAGYGQHRLEVEEPGAPELVPDVDYEFLRANLDARFRMRSFLFGLHGGYRVLLSMGQLESEEWFPRATGAGVEAGAFIGQALSESFELYGGFDILRYFFTMNPEPGDARVAGGAVDQYLSLWAASAWRFP